MNSKRHLRETFEYIHSLEEKARRLYDVCIGKVEDPEVMSALLKLRGDEARHVEMAEELLGLLGKYELLEAKVRSPEEGGLSPVFVYPFVGALLGLGAPAGAVLFRYLFAHGSAIGAWLTGEIAAQSWYYVYMTVGPVIVFTLAGSVLGFRHAKLKKRAFDLTVKTRVLEDVSEKDALTGLFNFGYIRERLALEIERSKRFQTPLSCLMIDVDNLKQMNDTYGHPAGDEVLRAVAKVLREDLRVIDTATRYGGDEFLVILPVTPNSGALVVAERLRKRLKDLSVSLGRYVVRRTVSVGIATYPAPNILDAESLVEAADQALYGAKRVGRDQTVQAAR